MKYHDQEFANDYMGSILRAIDVGIFITDHTLKIVEVNSHFEKVTTISREELLGHNVQYLLDKGYISKSICHMVAKELKPVTKILNYKGKAEKDVIVTGTPVFDAGGELKLIVCTLRDWNVLTDLYKELYEVKRQSEKYREQLNNIAIQQFQDSEFIANDRRTKTLLQMVLRVAKGDSSVLLLGESGVGKDMLARFIYKYSSRANEGRFVHVNCGAIPEALFESEFFGYAPGAFTGAAKAGKPGLIEIADNGILFLDEVGELPLLMQAKLLKVLQERTVIRVGDTQERKVNIKVIGATNQDLEHLVAIGRFRQDLFYRLNVFPIRIPSLRERKDDIPALISLFLNKYNNKHQCKKTIRPETMEVLKNYSWPGNVRELEHTIERLVVLCLDDVIEIQHLPESLTETMLAAEAIRLSETLPLKTIIERLERAVILNVIDKNDTLQDSAKQLGVDISTLTRKKQKYNIFKSVQRCTVQMQNSTPGLSG